LEIVFSISFVKILSISPVLPGFQGSCRKEWLRAEDRYKKEAVIPSFSVFS
jgi:hypothetical protein